MDPTLPRRVLSHPRVLVSLLVLAVLAVEVGLLDHERSGPPGEVRLVVDGARSTLTRETSTGDFAAGRMRGTAAVNGSLTMPRVHGYRTVAGVRYAWSRWTSPWVPPGQDFTELVPSWSAHTPAGSWVQVLVRVRDAQGRVSGFKDLGRWARGDHRFRRTSSGSQADQLASVATDTLKAQPGVRLVGYQLRLQLMRLPSRKGPTVRSISAVVSTLPSSVPPTSKPLSSTPVSLRVPGYSQMIHRGQDPQYGGGGEAWCSPTSLSMILGYYGRLPSPRSYGWVNSSYADRWVNQVARLTYDYRYQGTGNWPFNTALAANRLTDAFVTRLTDLRMAERFLRSGIPLEVSIRFGRGQLAGSPISSSPGHLVVLSGLTAAGNPIVMDPAAPSDSTVRRVYDRAQFERAWIGGSGGTAYVLRDAAHALPQRPAGVRAW